MSEKRENSEKKFISSATTKRLLSDVKNIYKNPLDSQGIYYRHDENDILKGYAMVFGPEGSLYDSGAYLFEITYPDNYPHAPPVFKFCTGDGHVRFNPNLYRNGKVCLSLLNTWRGEGWSACQTISSVLVTLCSILTDKPLLNEPGVTEQHADFDRYNKIITYKNYEIAILKMIDKKSGTLPNMFKQFYDVILENFNKNYDRLVKKISLLEEEHPKEFGVCTNLYSLSVNINYQALLKDFKTNHAKLNKKTKTRTKTNKILKQEN